MVSIQGIREDFITLNMLDNTSADASGQGPTRQQERTDDAAESEICNFSSRDQYKAKLVETDTHLSIELWLVKDPKAGRPKALLKCREVVEKPSLAPTIDARNAYNISLSYSASYLSITDATTNYLPKPESGGHPQGAFRIYEVVFKSLPSSSKSTDQSCISLVRSATVERLPGLQNYYGFGKFHIADDDDGDNIKKEIFVTCNGASVQVYSLYGGWQYLHTIYLDHSEGVISRFNVAAAMMMSRRNRLFAWIVCGTDMIAVYDMAQGSLVSYVTRPRLDRGLSTFKKTVLNFSRNGVLLAVYREGTLTTHYTKNGTLHKVLQFPPEYSNVSSIDFIKGNRQLIVHLRQEDPSRMEVRWLIINVKGLSIVGTSNPSEARPKQWLRVDDLNIEPYPPIISDCDDACQAAMAPLSQFSTEAVRSGLHFQVELQSTVVVLPWESRDLASAVVTITTLDRLSSRTFTIPPPCDNEYWWHYETAVFLEDRGQLVVEGQGLAMVWELPTTMDGDFTLDFVWLIGPRNAEWTTCSHCQLYYRSPVVPRHGSKVSDDDNQQTWIPLKPEVDKSFFQGICIVICMSLQASDAFKHAIFRYVGLLVRMNSLKTNALALVLEHWIPERYDKLERFMAAFLSSPSGTMHPTVDAVSYVRLVLLIGQKDPRFIGIARILIDKCIRQARAVMDPGYLNQIVRGLPQLLNPKHSHSVLALHTLRRLAYFPVSSRNFIINHHNIAHPPSFRLCPWGRHKRPLHLCKDPILQLSEKRIYDPQNDNFTRELFIAPFEMLWEVHRNKGASEAAKKVKAVGPARLVQQVLSALLYKLTPVRNTRVRCFDFNLEMLDNPALAALVEFKWNTIGFKYWLVRFLCECCYYLLVIVTVLMQTYGSAHQSSEALYIAIISCSAMFLYLEFIQCFRDWGRYFKSMYNLVDLLAFSFPLAAAISRLLILRDMITSDELAMQLNAGLFGFSIPMVLLHLLFQLRVLKTVSQFVVIITRIISRIRVFFFIFFAGLIAFTIAILHVLLSCPLKNTEKCSELRTTQLPSHFFKAFTATYFFMGGRYDPITDDLKSDNWAFQMLMIAYFFFTVILMLNVLIALLNVAFTNGDTSWRQVWLRNRMRVVESAENMSYQIPGFRKAHDWFPREIYYSVTHEQARGYKKRWASEGEGEDERDLLRDKGAPVVLLPGDASVGECANTSSSSRSASLSSGSNHSSTVVSSETGTEENAAASPPAARLADAPTTIEGLHTTQNKPETSLQYLVSKLERKMQLQQASFQDQIEKMDTRFRQQEQFYQVQNERQDARLQQLQASSNVLMRLLIEMSAMPRYT